MKSGDRRSLSRIGDVEEAPESSTSMNDAATTMCVEPCGNEESQRQQAAFAGPSGEPADHAAAAADRSPDSLIPGLLCLLSSHFHGHTPSPSHIFLSNQLCQGVAQYGIWGWQPEERFIWHATTVLTRANLNSDALPALRRLHYSYMSANNQALGKSVKTFRTSSALCKVFLSSSWDAEHGVAQCEGANLPEPPPGDGHITELPWT